jgi:hypothetical protein
LKETIYTASAKPSGCTPEMTPVAVLGDANTYGVKELHQIADDNYRELVEGKVIY